MRVDVERWAGPAPTEEQVAARLRAEGGQPRAWSGAPGERYGWHRHAEAKALYCVRGKLTFVLRDGELTLTAGDRLDLPAGTDHAAWAGPDGVRCVEAPVR